MTRPARSEQVILLTPAVVLLVGVFAVPAVLLVRVSFAEGQSPPFESGWTAEYFGKLLSDPFYLELLLTSIRLSAITAAGSLAIGIPLAFFLWRTEGALRGILLAATLLPLFTNVIARLYGWQILLANQGPVNKGLAALGLIDEPLRLNYSLFGAAVGLVYVVTPYVTLILFGGIAQVHPDLVHAAHSLGAGSFRSAFETVLPLMKPAIVTAIAVAFAWGMGAYAETATLGSPAEWGIGYETWRQHQLTHSWPFSSVLSIVMVVVTLLFTMVFARLPFMSTRVRGQGQSQPRQVDLRHAEQS